MILGRSLGMAPRRLRRYSQYKARAATDPGAVTSQRSAQLLGGERRGMQAVAVALGFGGEPGVEDPDQRLGRDAAAGVVDAELDPAVFARRAHRDPRVAGAGAPPE